MTKRLRRAILRGFTVSCLATTMLAGHARAETVGPVTDDVGVVKIPKGQPILIGALLVLSGPDLSLGLDASRGAEIAFDDHKNMLVGHPIKYLPEDGQCSVEGGQTGATRLASNKQIVGVIGTCLLVRIAGRLAHSLECRHAAGRDQRHRTRADGGGPAGRAAGDRPVRL